MTLNSRFVFDTNTVISALLFKQSIPRQAFDKARQQGEIVQSADTLAELETVLARDKFDRYITQEERIQFLAELTRNSLLMTISTIITECRDPKDNKFLSLAIDGQAEIIVSGDEDLLILSPFRRIRIMTPRTFIEQL